MPVDNVFMVGHGGVHTHLNVAKWYGGHAELENMELICMPFLGMGRISSAVCRDNTIIDACDIQRTTSGVVHGVFDAKAPDIKIHGARLKRGLAWKLGNKFLYGIDEESAGYIDYVAANGSYLDLMGLGMAIPAMTERGRLQKWTGSLDRLVDRHTSIRAEAISYIPRPGGWIYLERDLFTLLGKETWPIRPYYDVLILDLPYLSGDRDMYSRGTAWDTLNKIMCQNPTMHEPVSTEPWTYKNYNQKLHTILRRIKSRWLMVSWTDVRTSRIIPHELRNWLLEQTEGVLEDEQQWDARPKTLWTWRIRRRD